MCNHDLTHFLNTLRSLSVQIVAKVVIRDSCDTWHGLCAVTSIHSIQQSTRDSQKLGNKSVRTVSQWMADNLTVKTGKSSWWVKTSEEKEKRRWSD